MRNAKPKVNLYDYDNQVKAEGYPVLCGVDEAGRGPLVGRVYAAAVILPECPLIEALNDSKQLTEKKREELYDRILETAVDYGIGWADEKEIDELNILQATFLAMRRAAGQLTVKPDIYLVDGNRHPLIPGLCRCEVKGDGRSAAIAAASILAKVSRDRYMVEQDKLYPGYEFSQHKGYGTALHYQRLAELGPCPIHRKSFLKNLSLRPAPNQGQQGEDAATRWLTEHGYRILARNARYPCGEIDIIAANGAYIAFVEVKQRGLGSIDRPAAWVDKTKQKKILQAAAQWLSENPTDLQPRFDVVEVSGEENEINLIQNAFIAEEDSSQKDSIHILI